MAFFKIEIDEFKIIVGKKKKYISGIVQLNRYLI